MSAKPQQLFDQHAEEAVLGSLLIDPECIPGVVAQLRADDFYLRQNALIFAAICWLAAMGSSVDVLTVSERLEAQGDLAKIGGAARLTQLILAVPSAMHVDDYAAVVREWALRRKLLQSAGEIAKLAADSATDIEAVTSGSSAALLRAIQTPQELVVRTALEVGGATWQALNSGRSIFVPTGFADYDARFGGLPKSGVTLLAARPGMGKSTFLLNVAMHAARAGATVLFVSLEMTSEQLFQRAILATSSDAPADMLRRTRFEPRELEAIAEATGQLADLPLHFAYMPGVTIAGMVATAQAFALRRPLDMVIVDYVQLVRGDPSRRESTRQQEVGEVMRGLKRMAGMLGDVPVLAAAQMNRALELRAASDRKPQLSDLRESGDLENDADVVAFLHHGGVMPENARPTDFFETTVVVRKNRHGNVGEVPLLWQPGRYRFVNSAKVVK